MYNTDTDECALRMFECGERYACNNTEGSYECVCRPGYELSADKESCEGNLNSCKMRLYSCRSGCRFESKNIYASLQILHTYLNHIFFFRKLYLFFSSLVYLFS